MKIKIHKVLQGPHEDEDGDLNIVCLLKDDSGIEIDHIYSESLDELYEIQRWCAAKLEPYIFEVEDYRESNYD